MQTNIFAVQKRKERDEEKWRIIFFYGLKIEGNSFEREQPI